LVAFANALARSGEQKRPLTHKQLKALIASAKTQGDHQRLGDYRRQEAKRLAAKAKEHEEMATEYENQPALNESKNPGMNQGAIHCRKFAKLDQQEAEEAEALAKLHEQMAQEPSTAK